MFSLPVFCRRLGGEPVIQRYTLLPQYQAESAAELMRTRKVQNLVLVETEGTASGQDRFKALLASQGFNGPRPDTKAKTDIASKAATNWPLNPET